MFARLRDAHSEAVWLTQQIRPYTSDYLIAIGCVFATGLLGVVDPLLMKFLLDDALPAKSLTALSLVVSTLAITVLVRSILGAYGGISGARATQKTGWRLRMLIIRKLSHASFAFYRRAPAGDTFFRVERDVEQIADLGGALFLQAVAFSVSMSAVFGGLIWLNPTLPLVALPLNFLFWWLRKNLKPKLERLSACVQSVSSESNGILQEYLWALPQFQLLGCERTEARRVTAAYTRRVRAEFDRRRFEIRMTCISMSTVAVGTALVLGFGGYQVVRGRLSAGALVACYAWMTRLFDPFSTLLDMYSRFLRVGVSVRRVRELLDNHETVTEPALAPDAQDIQGTLELRGVSFRYDDGPPVLRDVDLHIDSGKRIALVGPSGAGKTTVGKLLVRMETIGSGLVLFDGRDVREYSVRDLRSRICYLPQEPLVVDRTIRANLLLGNAGSTEEDLWRALKSVRLDHVIQALPQGLDTRAGPLGTCLSGGERQRLVLARSLLRSPTILVLDEPTSALDEKTEAAVLNDLLAAFPTQTLILITHRASCLRWMHNVVVLENGRIAEDYSHADGKSGTDSKLSTEAALR
jgi:ABC-type bacteriocin/lantibiotic exporter with double-glycine peptidase domain